MSTQRFKYAKVTTADRQYVKVGVQCDFRGETHEFTIKSIRGDTLATFHADEFTTSEDGKRIEFTDVDGVDVVIGWERCGCGGTHTNVWIDGRWVDERRARRTGLIPQ